MKIEKKLITLMLVWVMLVTCIPMQQANAKTTGAKVAVTRAEWVSALLKQADIKTGKSQNITSQIPRRMQRERL